MLGKSVFISYVNEDSMAAHWIAGELRAVGVTVWIDKARLTGGDDWRAQISNAITTVDHFIPLFSSHWIARTRSVAFEELDLALAELSKRSRNSRYVLPVKLDPCEVEDRQVQGDLPLSGLHLTNFYGRSLWTSLRDLCSALGFGSIRMDHAEPLALGLPPSLSITNGAIIVEQTEPANDALVGLERQVMSGEIFRAFDNTIRFHATIRSPVQAVQQLDKQFGLNEVSTATESAYISTTSERPTRFVHSATFTLLRDAPIHPLFFGLPPATTDMTVTIDMHFGLVVEPRSIVGVVDVFIQGAGQGISFQHRQWAIMQAAYTRSSI